MPNPGQELATIDFESMLGGPLIAVVNAQAQAAMSTVNFIKEVGFEKQSGETDLKDASTNKPIYVSFKYPKEVSAYQPPVGSGDGTIASISLSNGGSGYTSAPTITISGGGGSGASATAAVNNGIVTAITLSNAGSNYTSRPTITFTGGGGSGAQASVSVNTPEIPAKIMDMKLEVPILTMLPIPFIRIDLTTIDFNAKINSVEYRKTDTSLNITGELEAKAGFLYGSAKLKVSTSYQRNTSQGMNVERTYSMAVHIKAVQEELPAGMEKILSILENAIREQPSKAAAPVVV